MEFRVSGLLKAKSKATTGRGMERAQSILVAARETLASAGFAGLSMRSVATRAGISLGNLQHYYTSREELVAALLEYMMDGYQAEISDALQAHPGSSGAERFELVMRLLIDRTLDPQTAPIFLEVWALSSRHAFASELVRRIRLREHKAMLMIVREMGGTLPMEKADLRASMMVMVIEGLLVQVTRNGLPIQARSELAQAAMRAVSRLATDFV